MKILRSSGVHLTLFEALAGVVLVASAVMVALLSAARFVPAWAACLTAIGSLALALAFVRAVQWRIAPRLAAVIGIVGLGALMLRWDPFLHVEGGQDQGLYVAMSAHIARTQSLNVTDGVRASLAPELRGEYDKDNNNLSSIVPGRFEGHHQPGVYISQLDKSAYTLQFYPLHPLWMSLFGSVFGDDNRVYALVFLSLLNILALSLLAYELAGRRAGAGVIAGALLALNPVHVFLSRFPVSENVTLFFTATAVYFFVRYFRDGQARGIELVLSAGAWAAAFFTHVGSFMYAPFLAAILMAGLLTASDASRRSRMVAYGLAILAAYGCSMAFAMRWSFPYTYDIYRIILGEKVGQFLLGYWPWAVIALAVAVAAGGRLLWAHRVAVLRALSAPAVDRGLTLALAVLVAAVVAYSLYQGYRLGFTNHFAGDDWLDKRWRLSGTGWNGFLHSAAAALALYVSPFVLLFFIAVPFARWRSMGVPERLVIAFICVFLVVRLVLDGFTPYYFYSRYLGVEVMPYLMVLAAVWLQRMLDLPALAPKAFAGAILAGAIGWQAWALAPQYPGGEMHRTHATFRPLAAQLRDRDLLIISGFEYPPLQTALDYYYGRNTVKVQAAGLRDAVHRHAPHWADIYILTQAPDIAGASYVGTFVMQRDSYQRAGPLSSLPMNSVGHEIVGLLYRFDRAAAVTLREGQVITFSAKGNSGPYLGTGWSGQERFMRWTEGTSATLVLPFADAVPLQLRFEVRAHNCVPVTVRVNGGPRARWTFTDCGGYGERIVQLRPEDVPGGLQPDLSRRPVTITFEMPEVKAPSEVSTATDPRKLGLSVTKIVVERPAAEPPASTARRATR